MAHRNSDNTGQHPGINIVTVESEAVEMAAFDKLGPRTRAALNDAPFEFCAASILDQAEDMLIDPQGRGGDACLAASIERTVKEGFKAPIAAFRLRPDRSRRRRARLA